MAMSILYLLYSFCLGGVPGQGFMPARPKTRPPARKPARPKTRLPARPKTLPARKQN